MLKISHTQISNEFIDSEMQNLNGSCVKCFLAICRKTIGWHKETDYISISQLQELTGLSNRVVIKAVNDLEAAALIKKERTKMTNRITINYDEKSQVELQNDEKSQDRVTKSHRQSDEKSHTKETNLNKLNKRNSINEHFTIFYEHYPRKINKQAALKSFTKFYGKDLPEINLLIRIINRWKCSEEFPKEKQFIPYPSSWLNQKRWIDFEEEAKPEIKRPLIVAEGYDDSWRDHERTPEEQAEIDRYFAEKRKNKVAQ